MSAFIVDIYAEGYEPTSFDEQNYQAAMEMFLKLKKEGLHPVFIDNITNQTFE